MNIENLGHDVLHSCPHCGGLLHGELITVEVALAVKKPLLVFVSEYDLEIKEATAHVLFYCPDCEAQWAVIRKQ